MFCQRCRGLLVRETFDGLSPEAGNLCMSTRCIKLWIYRGLRGSSQSSPPSCGKTSGTSQDSQEGRSRIHKNSL